MFVASALYDVQRSLRPVRASLYRAFEFREHAPDPAVDDLHGRNVVTNLDPRAAPRALRQHRASFCDDLRNVDPLLLQLHFPRLPSGTPWPHPVVLADYPLQDDVTLHLVAQAEHETLHIDLVERVDPWRSFAAAGHRWMWHRAHRDASDHEKYGGTFCEKSASMSVEPLRQRVHHRPDDEGARVMAQCALLDEGRVLEACELAGVRLDQNLMHVLDSGPLAFFRGVVDQDHPALSQAARDAAAQELRAHLPLRLKPVMAGMAPWRLREALLEHGQPVDAAHSDGAVSRHGVLAVGPPHGQRRWVLQANLNDGLNDGLVVLTFGLKRGHSAMAPMLPLASTWRGVEFELRRLEQQEGAGILRVESPTRTAL